MRCELFHLMPWQYSHLHFFFNDTLHNVSVEVATANQFPCPYYFYFIFLKHPLHIFNASLTLLIHHSSHHLWRF
jgi:hypothetical protein